MYDNFNNNITQPHGALEKEQHAKELEKRYTLTNYRNRSEQSNGLANNLGKTVQRIESLIGSLFM